MLVKGVFVGSSDVSVKIEEIGYRGTICQDGAGEAGRAERACWSVSEGKVKMTVFEQFKIVPGEEFFVLPKSAIKYALERETRPEQLVENPAIALPSDNHVWSLEDTSLATITQDGQFTAKVKRGSVRVFVQDRSKRPLARTRE